MSSPGLPFVRLVVLCLVTLAAMTIPTAQAINSTSLTDSSWPMYQRNPAHTGQSVYQGMTTAPTLLWTRKISGTGVGEYSRGMSIAADGTIYLSGFGDLYALDPRDGATRWQTDLGSHSRSVPAVGSDGRLYWGLDDSFLVLSAQGEVLGGGTNLSFNQSFGSSPVIAADGSVYFVHDGLWSFTADGDLRWVEPFGNFAHAAPAIGADGTIYTTAPDGFLYAFDADGDVIWSRQAGKSDSSPVIGGDGTIYVGEGSPTVYAFDQEGNQRWAFQTEENPFFGTISDVALGIDGTIYVGGFIPAGETRSEAVHFYAINPDGTLKWKQRFPRRIGESAGFVAPPLVDKHNRVFACAYGGSCYGFSSDGALLWEYVANPGGWNQTTPLLTADNVMWILDGAGVLHALADPATNILRAAPMTITVEHCATDEPIEQTLELTTAQPVTWSATIAPAAPWLTLLTTSGATPATIRLRIDPTTLDAGRYHTTLRLTTQDASVANPVLTIPIDLTVGCRIYLPTTQR